MSVRSDSRPATVQLVAVGDISFGDSLQTVGGGVHARFERVLDENRSYPFEHTACLFERANVVFGNLETVLTHRGLNRLNASSLEMRGHPKCAERLARAGFTVVNVANNHIMQYGMAGFNDTVAALHREGVGVVGVAQPAHRMCMPHRACVNGLIVSVLGFAFEKDKYADGRLGYAFGPECAIAEQISAEKTQSDLVICSLHWGVEFVRHPSQEEEALARQLVDAGADVVLGHHPHVARRVERYRHGLIAYSLGNFVFDMLWSPWLRTGLVLRAVLSKKGVEHYETELVWIGEDYQPRWLRREQAAEHYDAFAGLQSRPEWVSTQEYAIRYEELVKQNRHESYAYFLRTIGSRPVGYSIQTLIRTAHKKATAGLGTAWKLVEVGKNTRAL